MPLNKKRLQWKLIEENFEFDYVAGVKWAMSSLRDRWKAYKYSLRYPCFNLIKSKEDLLANPPSNVDSSEWTAFVHHYKELKAQCAQNAKNREKLKVSHAGGSMSNARRGRKMERKLKRTVCRGEVVLSTLLKKDGSYGIGEGKTLADKISENLSQDQEDVAIFGVPMKIYAHPDDSIGKVYGAERPGRVRGLGGSVCPSVAFGGLYRNLTGEESSCSSSNVPHQRVEDLEKQVESLEEKLAGYEETKEQLGETKEQPIETKKRLAQNENLLANLHKFLHTKFGDELPTFN